MYLVKTPLWLRMLYPGLTWHKERSKKIIYITFDDGPIPVVTPFVLDTLKNFGAKATFFCIGDNINKNPEIYERIRDEGHRVGNHTYNHLNGWKTDDKTYVDNYKKCQEITGTDLFRPPYGRISRSQILGLKAESIKLKAEERLKVKSSRVKVGQDLHPNLNTGLSGIQIIMWDVLSGDFDTKLHPQKCFDNVIWHAKNGSIIVFHDSLKAWAKLEYTLPRALEYWKAKGFEFGVL